MDIDMLDILTQATSTQDSDKLKRAKDKIRTEMDTEKDNEYVQEIGKFLLDQLGMNPGMADGILIKNKTILKSLDAMKKVAEKNKKGNFAILTPKQGFDIVMGYFDKELSPEDKQEEPAHGNDD